MQQQHCSGQFIPGLRQLDVRIVFAQIGYQRIALADCQAVVGLRVQLYGGLCAFASQQYIGVFKIGAGDFQC
ncbi:hypothetical protein D3C86_2106810 [compost metagenome]